jgi:Cellulose binding domain/Glycosyl hydrolases family 18
MPAHRTRLALVAAVALIGGVATFLLVQPAAQAATAAFVRTSSWAGGYEAKFTITNTTSSTIDSWTVEFDFPAGTSVGTFWDALVTTSGRHVTATNRNYNGTLAPGATTTFGFVAAGTGDPTNCTVNGAPCGVGLDDGDGGEDRNADNDDREDGDADNEDGDADNGDSDADNDGGDGDADNEGGDGGDGEGDDGGEPQVPDVPTNLAAIRVAPYVDMGAFPTPSLRELSADGNLKSFTLAFITASGCRAMWFNSFDPRERFALDQINAIRRAGGDVKISFGGATGVELAQACSSVDSLVAEYQAVVTAYSLKHIDLDIEGAATADQTSVERRSQALRRLQRANPGLRVSLTLPVLPEGLTADGLGVVRSARDAGVDIDVVNVMAMDYNRDGDYGDLAVQAAESTFDQLKELFPGRSDASVRRMVGVTPMLGQNDDGRVYDADDARQLVSFARSQGLGMLAFWEMTRDRNACSGPLFRCTNIAQQPFEFSRVFAGFTG